MHKTSIKGGKKEEVSVCQKSLPALLKMFGRIYSMTNKDFNITRYLMGLSFAWQSPIPYYNSRSTFIERYQAKKN